MKKHIFHLAWSPDTLPTVKAIAPLLKFLDTRLQELNARLLKGNLLRCMHILWEAVLFEIDDHAESNTSVRTKNGQDHCTVLVHRAGVPTRLPSAP